MRMPLNRSYSLNPLIALTGGIACGKSLAQSFLKDAGIHACVDTDAVCHRLYRHLPDDAARKMRAAWGGSVVSDDGSVDRESLSRAVFSDAAGTDSALALLHEIIHPEIERETARLVRSFAEDGYHGPVLVAVPLLYEYDLQGRFDKVVAVWCSREAQIARLMARGGFSRDEAIRRIDVQMPVDRKLELADFGLINNGTPDALRIQCETLARQLNDLYI